jgi:hypothetical protein
MMARSSSVSAKDRIVVPAVSVDFYARDMYTGRGHGLNGLGHVLLPECSWRARHGSMWSGQ